MILVFKTSVKDTEDISVLNILLQQQQPGLQWNIDLEDCDRILRIVSETEISATVIRILQENGYVCEELQE